MFLDPGGHGGRARLLVKLGSVQLLIPDNRGLEPVDAKAPCDLLEILEKRYGRRQRSCVGDLIDLKRVIKRGSPDGWNRGAGPPDP